MPSIALIEVFGGLFITAQVIRPSFVCCRIQKLISNQISPLANNSLELKQQQQQVDYPIWDEQQRRRWNVLAGKKDCRLAQAARIDEVNLSSLYFSLHLHLIDQAKQIKAKPVAIPVFSCVRRNHCCCPQIKRWHVPQASGLTKRANILQTEISVNRRRLASKQASERTGRLGLLSRRATCFPVAMSMAHSLLLNLNFIFRVR